MTDYNSVYQKETVMKIDIAAIKHNVDVVRTKTSQKIIAVIKENGYGMGLEKEYHILKQCGLDYFAVTNANEAIALRELGANDPILLLSPYYDQTIVETLLEKNITLMLNHLQQLELLTKIYQEKQLTAKVHIAVETGMGRYGFPHHALPDFRPYLKFITIEGCYSHFNGEPKEYTKQQARFQVALEQLKAQNIIPPVTHLSNSAATMTIGDCGCTAVRIGSAFLGKVSRGGSQLKQAVWIEAPISQIITLPKGSSISYNATLHLKRDSRLGLVRVGHGDGLFLSYADTKDPSLIHGILHLIREKLQPDRYRLYGYIQNTKVPIIGRSGIAHVMLDLTDTDFTENDTVTFNLNPLLVHPAVPKDFINSY